MDEKQAVTGMSIASLGSDYALLRSIYGEDQAIEYMVEMYGVNPLALAPSTWASLSRPVTREAFLDLEANEKLLEVVPFTLMAWIAEDDGEFYSEAWRAQLFEKAREKLSPQDAAFYMGHISGSYRMRKLREDRDTVLEAGAALYGGRDNDDYRALNQYVVKPWYNSAAADIYLQYWAYGPNSGVTGLTNRPSFKEVLGELREISDPLTEAYREALNMNPEVLGFVQYTMGQWEQNEQISLRVGNTLTWWETSTATSTGADMLRQGFQYNMNRYLDKMSESARNQAEWIVQTVYQPLLEGFDFDNPIIIAPTLVPEVASADADRMGEP
jgi:hypothetical protein